MISTRDLSRLPDIGGLQVLSQSLAMLDAILCPAWEYRYYSFNVQMPDRHLRSQASSGPEPWEFV